MNELNKYSNLLKSVTEKYRQDSKRTITFLERTVVVGLIGFATLGFINYEQHERIERLCRKMDIYNHWLEFGMDQLIRMDNELESDNKAQAAAKAKKEAKV